MNSLRILPAVGLAMLLVASACSSGPQGRGGGGGRGAGGPNGGPGGMMGANMPTVYATPLALVFVGMDQDGDGATARAEAEAWSAQAFGAADTNGDGQLRPIEFAGFARTFLGTDDAAVGTTDFDRNLDGQISLREFEGFLLYRFNRFDTNVDEVLQRSELLQTFEMRSSGRGGQRGGGQNGGGQRQQRRR